MRVQLRKIYFVFKIKIGLRNFFLYFVLIKPELRKIFSCFFLNKNWAQKKFPLFVKPKLRKNFPSFLDET